MLKSISESAFWDIQPVTFSVPELPMPYLAFAHSSCIFTKGSPTTILSPGAGQSVAFCGIFILAQRFSNLSMLEGLLKHRFLGPTPRIPDSVCLGWHVGMRIFSIVLDDAAAVGEL